jgi:hypothetical protein
VGPRPPAVILAAYVGRQAPRGRRGGRQASTLAGRAEAAVIDPAEPAAGTTTNRTNRTRREHTPMTRNQIYLRRLNPDGESLGVVDALEVDDRTFRQFLIDLLVDTGLKATDEQIEGTIATVVVGDRDAGELLGAVPRPATDAASSGTPPPATEPTTGDASGPPTSPATTS